MPDNIVDPFSEAMLHPKGGVANLLRISLSSVERFRQSGELAPWIYVGNRPYIKGSDLKRFIDSRSATRPGAEIPEAAE
jgi:hypothetical protein